MADFIRVGMLNAEQLFSDGKLEKGTLVKYRAQTHTMTTHTHSTMTPKDYYWQYGIISEVLWYARTPRIGAVYTTDYPIVYDLTVHNIQEGKKDFLDFNNFEIMILVE